MAKRKRIPDSYTVLGRPYTVRRLAENEKAPHGLPESAYGGSNHYTDEAVISHGLSPAQERDTLLHEVLHSIVKTTGISELVGKRQEHEESIISALTPQLLHFLQSNPDVVRYLTEVP